MATADNKKRNEINTRIAQLMVLLFFSTTNYFYLKGPKFKTEIKNLEDYFFYLGFKSPKFFSCQDFNIEILVFEIIHLFQSFEKVRS